MYHNVSCKGDNLSSRMANCLLHAEAAHHRNPTIPIGNIKGWQQHRQQGECQREDDHSLGPSSALFLLDGVLVEFKEVPATANSEVIDHCRACRTRKRERRAGPSICLFRHAVTQCIAIQVRIDAGMVVGEHSKQRCLGCPFACVAGLAGPQGAEFTQRSLKNIPMSLHRAMAVATTEDRIAGHSP